jgi:hypothetical protein
MSKPAPINVPRHPMVPPEAQRLIRRLDAVCRVCGRSDGAAVYQPRDDKPGVIDTLGALGLAERSYCGWRATEAGVQLNALHRKKYGCSGEPAS